MALTEQKIFEIMNETLNVLGFDTSVNSENIDSVGIISPEQVNRFVDAINPIIHDRIMSNIGNRGILKRFRSKLERGSTSRDISLGILPEGSLFNNFEEGNGSYHLASLVGKNNSIYADNDKLNSAHIQSINTTFNPYVTIDRRELAKTFTFSAMAKFISKVGENIEENLYAMCLQRILSLLQNDEGKTISYEVPNDRYLVEDLLDSAETIKTGLSTRNIGVQIPDNVKTNLASNDILILQSDKYGSWYTKLHFKPDSVERHPIFYNGNNSFVIPYEAIVINEYYRSTETQPIPNIPSRYNVFYHSDMSIGLNFDYPIFKLSGGK